MRTKILFSNRHQNVSRSGLTCLNVNATINDLSDAISNYSDDYYGKCLIIEDESELFEAVKATLFEGKMYDYKDSGCKDLYTRIYMTNEKIEFSKAGLYFDFEYVGEHMNCGDETIYLSDLSDLTELELGTCFNSLSHEEQLYVAEYYSSEGDMLSNEEFAMLIKMEINDFKHGGDYTITADKYFYNDNFYDSIQDVEEYIEQIEAE